MLRVLKISIEDEEEEKVELARSSEAEAKLLGCLSICPLTLGADTNLVVAVVVVLSIAVPVVEVGQVLTGVGRGSSKGVLEDGVSVCTLSGEEEIECTEVVGGEEVVTGDEGKGRLDEEKEEEERELLLPLGEVAAGVGAARLPSGAGGIDMVTVRDDRSSLARL